MRPYVCICAIVLLALVILPLATEWARFSHAQEVNGMSPLGPQKTNLMGVQPTVSNITCDYTTYQVGNRIVSHHAGTSVIRGTNATDVIQRTLDSLPMGGTECLTVGTYRLDHGLLISKSYVTLRGSGVNTILTFASPATKDNLLTIGLGVTTSIDPSRVTGAIRNVTVSNVFLSGQKTSVDPAISGGQGFEVRNIGIWVLGAEYTTIANVWVGNVGQYCVTFRATGPDIIPYSEMFQPSLYDEVIGSHFLDCRTGVFFDGVVQAPSNTMGRGNRIVGNGVVQDWGTMNIDATGNSQGFGIADFGNMGTLIIANHVEGYTPNPASPSHTSYAAYLVDGNSSALILNDTAVNSYFGVGFGFSGAASSASTQTMIDGFATRDVRYSIGIAGVTNSLTVRGLSFTDPFDIVNGLAGIGVWIWTTVNDFDISNLQGQTDGGYAAVGTDALLQTARGVAGLGKIEVVGGAQNNLDLDFIIDSYPAGLTIENVSGYNPVGHIGNPFSSDPVWISPFGDTSTPIASADYTVNGSDIYLTSTGGVGVAITIKDSDSNLIAGPAGDVNGYLVKQGFVINFGAFVEAPSVTISGD